MEKTQGKAVVARRSDGRRSNAIRHGLRANAVMIAGESPIAFGRMVSALYREFRPQGPAEKMWVSIIIENRWRLRRADILEAGLLGHSAEYGKSRLGGRENGAHDPRLLALGVGVGFLHNSAEFLHLARYRGGIERVLFRALTALQASQAQRRGPAPVGEVIDVTQTGTQRQE